MSSPEITGDELREFRTAWWQRLLDDRSTYELTRFAILRLLAFVYVVAFLVLRWIIFRIMLGAALIKLRNDSCWVHLTCLDYHFETQPNPNPLAWWMHKWPHGVHVAQVLFNHFVELVVPWFVFGPRKWRHTAGAFLVLFQISLIVSGNLSFLNWLTIVPALACFDDTAWGFLIPAARRRSMLERFATLAPSRLQTITTRALGGVIGFLSLGPTLNLVSSEQAMNRSFEPFDLVNTYGAFGDVDRTRYEVILEGTRDEEPTNANWEEYELPCMPGDVARRPCIITPYHYRLDWQMWFVGNGAARGEPIEEEPWLVHLVWKLLEGDASVRPLFARDPFADGAPPKWIRADIWEYRFTQSRSDGWWQRERVGVFLRPISLDDPTLRRYVTALGWMKR